MKKILWANKFFCIILSIFILCSSLVVLAEPSSIALTSENTDVISSDGYEFIAESNGLKMYADINTGLFKLVDKKGKEFYSVSQSLETDTKTSRKNKMAYGSQLILQYAVNEDFVSTGKTFETNSNVGCVNKGTVGCKKIENGIRVNYNFENIEIIIPVEYKLVDGKLSAEIISSQIKEGKDASLIQINLLPSFGAASEKEKGYIMVPDGSGAIMYFNSDKTENKYSAQIYGPEMSLNHDTFKTSVNEVLRLPVFGICRPGESAILGNITLGDGSSKIEAVIGNMTCGQNLCFSTMIYRTITSDKFENSKSSKIDIFRLSEQKYSLDKYIVNYSILNGEQSDYSTLASEYRDYLVNEKGLSKNDNADLINLDAYGALEVAANFLGFKYTKLKALTGYEDLITILDELKNSGINDVSYRYIGWQNDGIFNKKIANKNKLLSVLGGRSDWKKLQTYVNENKINAVYDVDLIQYRKSFFNKAASTTFNKKAWQYQYGRSNYVQKLTVDSWLNLKPSLLPKNSNKYLNDLSKSVENISLSTISNLIYSDFKENKGTYRSDFPNIATEVLKKYKNAGLSISGENANAYAFPYLNVIYKAPTSSSGYKIFDRDVPFYQMVLKGYISMTTNSYQANLRQDDEFLKAVETGSALLYNCMFDNSEDIRGLREESLYSSEYKLWKNFALEHYKKYSSLYNELRGKTIVRNYEVMENVMVTEFENGTKVYVNYNYEDVKAEGIDIKARSFSNIKGGENSEN